MEDDALRRPAPAGPRAAFWLLVTLGVLGTAARAPAAPAAKGRVPLSPLPPLGQRSTPPASAPTLPTLLAQAEQADQSKLPTFDDEQQGDKGDKKEAVPAPGCRGDADCQARSLCVEGACKPLKRRVSALFYFHQPGDKGFRIVIPFYFSFWQPRERSRLVFPLFYQASDDKEKTSDLIVPPLLYQYHREPGATSHRVWPIFFYSNYGNQGSAFGLLPLFYGARRGPRTQVLLPLLLSFYRNDSEQKLRDLLVLGLVYDRRRGDSRLLFIPPLLSFHRSDSEVRETLFLPGLTYLHRDRKEGDFGIFAGLGWYRKTSGSLSAGVFPLAWYSRSGPRHSTVVLPLFVEGADAERELRHVTLFPFFHYRREGQRRLVITPLGGQYRDLEAGVRVNVLLTPPLIHRDEPRYRFTTVPPLALWWRNKETGATRGFVGPAFWWNDDQGETGGLLPLYLRFHDRRGQASTHLLLPVGLLHRSPRLTVGVLGPLYFWSRPAAAGEGAGGGGGLLPILWASHRKTRDSAGLFPLFAWARDREAGTTHLSIGPFFYRQRASGPAAEQGYDAGLLPLVYFGRRGESRYRMLLPLYYERAAPGQQQLLVGPFYFGRDDRPGNAGRSAVLFPLLFFRRGPADGHLVLFPLLWFAHQGERSAGVVGPVFFSRGPGARRSAGLFPLFYLRHDTAESLALSPAGGYYRDARTRVLGLGPFFRVERDGNRSTALLPLLFFRRGPDSSASVVFPFFFHARQGAESLWSALYLFYHVRRPGLAADVLFPLLWRVGTEQSRTTIVGPAFYSERRDGQGRSFGLLPLFGYARGEHATTLVTPLGFYRHNDKDERTRSVFGLFYGDFRRGRSDFGVFPLFYYARRATASAWLFFPFAYRSSDPAQDRGLTVLLTFYFGHRGAATFGGLLPLFFGKNDGQGSYQMTALPFFHLRHTSAAAGGPSTTLLTALFGFRSNPSGYLMYLGPFYLRREAQRRSEALWPLFYHTRDPVADVSTTLVLPLVYRRSTPESSLTAVTPLFWHYANLTQSVAFGFPLVLDLHTRFHSRTTAVGPLLPLLVRHRDYAENTTSWYFPPLLTYVKRHADGHHDAVFFPLLWHFGGQERSSTVFLPLFYHWRRPERETTVLFPLFYSLTREGYRATVMLPLFGHVRTERGHHLIVLNTYTYRGVGARAGEWDFHFWPLFQVGRPRVQDLEWNVLGGLFGYSRLGPNRTLRLLWGIFIPLAPAPSHSLRTPARRPARLALLRRTL